MDTKKAEELLARYKNGTLTQQEKVILDAWYLQLSRTEKLMLSESAFLEKRDKLWSRIMEDVPAPTKVAKLGWLKWASVAATLIIIGSATFYAVRYTTTNRSAKAPQEAANDIAPGSNKAIITLANGQKISLTDAGKGQLANEAGAIITKTADGQVIYNGASKGGQIAFNSIATPKGGQYALILSDGTKVTLNAASSLRYPTTFSGGSRTVELIGEAFFEVAKDKARPFIVSTGNQNVKVLGTHFNINGYPNEPDIKTTLIEGSVQVSKLDNEVQHILKPGQQSIFNRSVFKIEQVETDDAVAWKNGYFQFNGKSLETAMLEVCRWYDVEVEYKNQASRKQALAGTILKYGNVSNIIRTMELTGVLKFSIVGRKIIVE